MHHLKILMTIVTLTVAAVAAAESYRIDLPFTGFVWAGMYEQDLFVVDDGAAYRFTAVEERMHDRLHTSRHAVPHNPADEHDVGPFEPGRRLTVIMAEWLAASGRLALECDEGRGTLDASFEALVPNAVYTMWLSYVVMPMTVPFSAIDIPLGPHDGSANTFTTDDDGAGTYATVLDDCIAPSRADLATVISIAYHSDGATHGLLPGDFGRNTHVQLFAFLPTEADIVDARGDRR